MPAIITGEGAFAASGTSLAIYGTSDIYFGTGGGAKARVFHSMDLGKTWTVSDTPLAAGNASSGVFSIVRVKNTVIAVGGDYRVANGTCGRRRVFDRWRRHMETCSSCNRADIGQPWRTLEEQMLVSVGPNGGDLSPDSGIRGCIPT